MTIKVYFIITFFFSLFLNSTQLEIDYKHKTISCKEVFLKISSFLIIVKCFFNPLRQLDFKSVYDYITKNLLYLTQSLFIIYIKELNFQLKLVFLFLLFLFFNFSFFKLKLTSIKTSLMLYFHKDYSIKRLISIVKKNLTDDYLKIQLRIRSILMKIVLKKKKIQLKETFFIFSNEEFLVFKQFFSIFLNLESNFSYSIINSNRKSYVLDYNDNNLYIILSQIIFKKEVFSKIKPELSNTTSDSSSFIDLGLFTISLEDPLLLYNIYKKPYKSSFFDGFSNESSSKTVFFNVKIKFFKKSSRKNQKSNEDYDAFSLIFKDFYFQIEINEVTNIIKNIKESTMKESKNILNKVSHEVKSSCISINNLILQINQIIDNHLSGFNVNSQVKTFLEKITIFCDYMTNTIHQIHYLIDDFKSDLAFENNVNLKQEMVWLMNLTKTLMYSNNKYNIRVKLMIDNENSQFFIRTDKEKLRIILTEIIKNSINFTFSGEILLILTYSCMKTEKKYSTKLTSLMNKSEPYDKYVKIIIKDTGKGMSPQMINQLKERMSMSSFKNMSQDNFAKTGALKIGLLTINSYLNLLNLSLEINSSLKKGTQCVLVFNNSISKSKESNNKYNIYEESRFSYKNHKKNSFFPYLKDGFLLKRQVNKAFTFSFNQQKKRSFLKILQPSSLGNKSKITFSSFYSYENSLLNKYFVLNDEIISPPSTGIGNGNGNGSSPNVFSVLTSLLSKENKENEYEKKSLINEIKNEDSDKSSYSIENDNKSVSKVKFQMINNKDKQRSVINQVNREYSFKEVASFSQIDFKDSPIKDDDDKKTVKYNDYDYNINQEDDFDEKEKQKENLYKFNNNYYNEYQHLLPNSNNSPIHYFPLNFPLKSSKKESKDSFTSPLKDNSKSKYLKSVKINLEFDEIKEGSEGNKGKSVEKQKFSMETNKKNLKKQDFNFDFSGGKTQSSISINNSIKIISNDVNNNDKNKDISSILNISNKSNLINFSNKPVKKSQLTSMNNSQISQISENTSISDFSKVSNCKSCKDVILVVDDNFYCRQTLKNQIRSIFIEFNIVKYDLVSLNDGLDLISFVIKSIKEGNDIKLIITDENMIHCNGSNSILVIFKLFSLLNLPLPKPKTVILTALEGFEVSDELKKKTNESVDVIRKPINKSTLLDLIVSAKMDVCK